MRRLRLRTQILLSVSVIIFVVLGTSTLIHIRDMQRDYFESLTWRSEALAQQIIAEIRGMHTLGLDDVTEMFPPLALCCVKLYEANKEKHIAHVAVIYPDGIIGPHSDPEHWNTPVASPLLKAQLPRQKQVTILDHHTYHTLVPVLEEDLHWATIDIGTPKDVMEHKIQGMILQSVLLFGLFLLLAFALISGLMHVLLTRPVRQLVTVGQQLAAGQMVQLPAVRRQSDEIAVLSAAFNRISEYLRNLAEVATAIAIGDVRKHVPPRSDQDILGIAFQRMTEYLQRLATAATAIAQGDLQQPAQPESENDVLGNAFHTMAVQLRENFENIQRLNEELERRVADRTAELARKNYILQTFMDTVPDRIYFKDRAGRITNANRAHALYFGFNDPQEEVGKTDFDLLPPELAQLALDQEEEILRTGAPLLEREFPSPQPDGTVRWALSTKMPLRDEHGQIIGTFGVSRDITTMKQAQTSLEQAYSEILALNHQLQEQSLRYYMKALLLGTPSMPSVGGMSHTMRAAWHAPLYCVVLLKLLPTAAATRLTAFNHTLMSGLAQIYEESREPLALSGVFSQITDTEAALILNAAGKPQIQQLCELMASQTQDMLRQHAAAIVIGIGNLVETPEDLHVSYETAQQAILARHTLPATQILSASESDQRKKEALLFYFPVEKEQQLITAVIAGQQTVAREVIQDIIAQNTLEQSSYQKLTTLYTQFLQTAGKILAQAPIRDMGAGESSILQAFRAARPETLQDFRSGIEEIFRQLLTLYAPHDRYSNNVLAQKFFRYLERHSVDPQLSLERIAEAFKLNPSYLSRYFKEHTGMNYVDYVAMLRVKNAKNLLVAHPGQNMQEIGMQAGFSGKETFIRTFKRFEGVTPGTYRKRALAHAEV